MTIPAGFRQLPGGVRTRPQPGAGSHTGEGPDGLAVRPGLCSGRGLGRISCCDVARKKPRKDDRRDSLTPRIRNRRGSFDYHVLEKIECGIELLGTEVKSLRAGNASLEGAYARTQGGEVFLCGANIAIWPQAAGVLQHDPLRQRKLLLHHRQIHQLAKHTDQKGHTLVPLALYFRNGWAKCELAAAVGKRAYDKRQAIQKRQQQRDVQRALRRRKR